MSASENESNFMKQAIELGEMVKGTTGDNPWVGCVIVKAGQVIATGHTHPPGGSHAEADAIQKAEAAGYSLQGATLYCTVEPCSFHGRTPACAKTIVQKQIKEVFFSIRDPHPKVDGAGLKILQDAGVKVHEGLEEKTVRESLSEWLKNYEN